MIRNDNKHLIRHIKELDWVNRMNEPELPDFPSLKMSIMELGAISNTHDESSIETTTTAIQKTICSVNEQGGGTVVIPAGIWYTGPIELLSNVRLHLEPQAVLKFIKDKKYYPLIVRNYEGEDCIKAVSPIHAECADNIAITGKGVIDGSGELWRPVKQCKVTDKLWNELCDQSQYIFQTSEGGVWFPSKSSYLGNQKNIQGTSQKELELAEEYYDFYRPVMVSLVKCNKVLFEGVTFMNSPAWNIHPLMCSNLTVRNGLIRNPYYAQNGDGIDVESCNGAHIHHMVFQTGDDAICLKAGKDAKARQIVAPCQNVWVHDCTVFEGHGGLVIGSEMSRNVEHVLVEGCRFLGTDVGIRVKSAIGRGGVVSDIAVRDIAMVDIKKEAVLLTMKYVIKFWDEEQKEHQYTLDDVPHFRDIYMENIHCESAETAIRIEPLDEYEDTIKDVYLSDSYFRAKEGYAGENMQKDECLHLKNDVFESINDKEKK